MSDCCKKLIYRYLPSDTPGLRARWWDSSNGPHIDPYEWSGPADDNGFPLPTANPPNIDIINNNTNVNDSNSGAGAARYGIIDGWIYLPPGTTHIRDRNSNTGELGMVLSVRGCCGGVLSELPGGNHTVNTGGGDRTLLDSTPATEGWMYIYNPSSDASAFHGLQLQYSTDNEASWSNVEIKQPNLPEVQCIEVTDCTPVPEGWSIKPLRECCAPSYINTSSEPPLVTRCTGNFEISSNRTGWWDTWTDITQDVNVPNTISDWYDLGNAVTSPDCITDLSFDVDFGNHYILSRRNLSYLWIDYRLLVNGVAVLTRTFETYDYLDERTNVNDEIENVQSNIFSPSDTEDHRLNIPAGATVQVQSRARYRTAGSQTSAYFRYIGGLRSNVGYHFSPQTIVIDVS